MPTCQKTKPLSSSATRRQPMVARPAKAGPFRAPGRSPNRSGAPRVTARAIGQRIHLQPDPQSLWGGSEPGMQSSVGQKTPPSATRSTRLVTSSQPTPRQSPLRQKWQRSWGIARSEQPVVTTPPADQHGSNSVTRKSLHRRTTPHRNPARRKRTHAGERSLLQPL